ncbi:MAG: hypothetical protein ACE5F1_14400 [Planctomycetota bacterium]
MFARWRRDLEELRSTRDSAARGSILFLWIVTAVIVLLVGNFLLGILERSGLL